jgi:hypothetical protein
MKKNKNKESWMRMRRRGRELHINRKSIPKVR